MSGPEICCGRVRVALHSPTRDRPLRVPQKDEPCLVRELIREAGVEALDERMLHGLPRRNAIGEDAAAGRPLIHRLARDIRLIVAPDLGGSGLAGDGPIERLADVHPGEVGCTSSATYAASLRRPR